MVQQHEVAWGDLLFDTPFDPTVAPWQWRTLSEGTNFGNPVSITEVLRSLWISGSAVLRKGWDNREFPIRLQLTAFDGEAAAQAEAELMQMVTTDQFAPLRWTPPLDESATSYFDVEHVEFERDTSDGWDQKETLFEKRYYVLTFTARPFVRPAARTTVSALTLPVDPAAEPVVEPIDDGTSTTGWTAIGSPSARWSGLSVATSAGAVHATGTVSNTSNAVLNLNRAGAVDMTDTPYLFVDAKISDNIAWVATITSDPWLVVGIPGVGNLTLLAKIPQPDGYTRFYFEPGLATLPSIATALRFPEYALGYDGPVVFSIADVGRTDRIPLLDSTLRQQSRLVTVTGSAPTEADLRIWAEDDLAVAGGDVLAYTSRDTDWLPPLRRHLDTAGVATADATSVSGTWTDFTAPAKYLVPTDTLGEGAHALYIRLASPVDPLAAATALTWTARLVDADGTDTLASDVVQSGDIVLDAGFEDPTIFCLGALVVDDFGPGWALEVEITSGDDTLAWDDAWLFSLDNGVLTWVKAPGAIRNLVLQAPQLGRDNLQVLVSPDADGTRSLPLATCAQAAQPHSFRPGVMQVFTIVTGSLGSQCSLDFYERYHSHVWAGAASFDALGPVA